MGFQKVSLAALGREAKRDRSTTAGSMKHFFRTAVPLPAAETTEGFGIPRQGPTNEPINWRPQVVVHQAQEEVEGT